MKEGWVQYGEYYYFIFDDKLFIIANENICYLQTGSFSDYVEDDYYLAPSLVSFVPDGETLDEKLDSAKRGCSQYLKNLSEKINDDEEN
jgi:hypothetical protein